MIELGVEGEGADRENEKCDIGIKQEIEYALLHRHLLLDNRRTDQIQCRCPSVKPFDRLAFDLLEQVILVTRNVIDQMLVKRLLIGKRLRFAYRRFGQRHISSSRPDKR